jgi:hypothetical protein
MTVVFAPCRASSPHTSVIRPKEAHDPALLLKESTVQAVRDGPEHLRILSMDA